MLYFTYVSEFDDTQFAHLCDALVSGICLQKHLPQGHLLTPEDGHFWVLFFPLATDLILKPPLQTAN